MYVTRMPGTKRGFAPVQPLPFLMRSRSTPGFSLEAQQRQGCAIRQNNPPLIFDFCYLRPSFSLGARPGAGSDPASFQAPGGLSSSSSSFLTSSWAAVPWARPFRSKGRAQLDAAGCRLVGLLGEPGKRLLLQDAGAGTTHEDAGAGTTQEWVVNMAI